MNHVTSTVTISNAAARRLQAGALWFSEREAIGRTPIFPGIASVFDARGSFLARAFVSPGSRYFLRVIAREDRAIDAAFFRERIEAANRRRAKLSEITDAYRVVHAESDGLPSIVVDRYADVCSLQITSPGAETMREQIVRALVGIFEPASIILKAESAMRRAERLPTDDAFLLGSKATALVREGDQRFEVDVLTGQKTGAYLDYRSIRRAAKEMARGRCLDAFCYQGWLSCQIASKAERVVAVDASQAALDAARRNAVLNGRSNIDFVRADAFDFLTRCNDRFDFVHVDPPAMAKERAHLHTAIAAYRKLAAAGINLLDAGGTLLISSCSHKITERMLEEVALDALNKSGRNGKIVWRGIQDIDHPILRGFPESLYLKAVTIEIS
jgi:23S rRNA (cytosine1962-C5)-methyltransferase